MVVTTRGVSDESKRRHELQLATIDQVGQGFRVLVFGTVVVLVAYFAKESLVEMAGKSTIIDFLAQVKVSIRVAWIGTAGCALWGYRERVLRKRVIKKFGEQRKHYEEALDAKRTSSGLSDDGSNNPQDEI